MPVSHPAVRWEARPCTDERLKGLGSELRGAAASPGICYKPGTLPVSDSAMSSEPTYTVRNIGGHFHMVVTVRGKETFYPAASEVGAEMMIRLEKHRLAKTGPHAPK